ncbi:MAG: hypothetical protein ACREBW_05440, partial [Candidatus Micrarchaeaceae archaeon]
MLSGALRFAPAVGQEIPLEILGDQVECWKCNEHFQIITHFNIAASRVFKGFGDWDFMLSDIDRNPLGLDLLAEILPSAAALKEAGVGEIKERYSNTVQGSYISNGCVLCDALYGSYFLICIRARNPAGRAHENGRSRAPRRPAARI